MITKSMSTIVVIASMALITLMPYSNGLNHQLNKCIRYEKNAAFSAPQNRRDIISKTVSLVGSLVTAMNPSSPAFANEKENPLYVSNDLFSVYEVKPDASELLSPSIKPVSSSKFKEVISQTSSTTNKRGGVIWLGEHHNSQEDHSLQAEFIRSIYEDRKKTFKNKTPIMSIGLEQVQIQYQAVLDDFISNKITEEEMLEGVQWKTRWTWPYDNYRPIFSMAKELKIPLIALNVNSEDLAAVETEGLKGLSTDQIRKYIKDPVGFAEFAKPRAFRTYVAYVIEPSYELHKDMGLLKYTISGQELDEEMSFRNFFSGRILWDEAMAGNAFSWTMQNPDGIMVGLVGADHVKFDKGIPGRYSRLVNGDRNNVSVLLNPTLIDTRPSGSVSSYMNASSSSFPDQITLQLRYVKESVDMASDEMRLPSSTAGVLSLADYIVISKKSSENQV